MPDKEELDYYEHQIAMFASPGWKYFTEQVREMRQATDSLRGVKLEDVRFRQGELSIIDWVLGWAEQVKNAYDVSDAKPTSLED